MSSLRLKGSLHDFDHLEAQLPNHWSCNLGHQHPWQLLSGADFASMKSENFCGRGGGGNFALPNIPYAVAVAVLCGSCVISSIHSKELIKQFSSLEDGERRDEAWDFGRLGSGPQAEGLP